MAPLDAMARLRHDGLARSPGYPGGSTALGFHRDVLTRAVESGGWAVVEDDGLLGCVATTVELDLQTGRPYDHLIVARQDRDWHRLQPLVDAALARLGADVRAIVPPWDQPLRAHLESRGLALVSVTLAGRVAVARAALGEVATPEDLEIRPIQAEDVPAAVALFREVFSAEPQYCAFGADPHFLSALARRLADPALPACRLVVSHAGALRGLASAWYNDEDHHHGRSAGLDLVLHATLRGRRLTRAMYRPLLDAMAARGCGWLKGTTAQPAVWSLGARLGRHVTGLNLRAGPGFPPGWFDTALRP